MITNQERFLLKKKWHTKLQNNKFNYIIDEIAKCSPERVCYIVVKYFDNDNLIKVAMLDLIHLYDGNDGSSGVSKLNDKNLVIPDPSKQYGRL